MFLHQEERYIMQEDNNEKGAKKMQHKLIMSMYNQRSLQYCQED